MRTALRLVAVSSVVVAGACSGKGDSQAARLDVKKPAVAVAPTSPGDLSTAPQAYTRMRFVSPIEQSRSAAPARGTVRAVVAVNKPHAAHAPIVSLASMDLKPVSTSSSMSSMQAPMQVAAHLAAEPAPMAMPAMSMDLANAPEAEHQVGHAVIRGGRAGTDKCDPRTDTHTTPQEMGRPDFAMPLPTGRANFGGVRR